jgi:mono/diheme cytochrome c family protein
MPIIVPAGVWLDSAAVRRLLPLLVLLVVGAAVLGAGCSVPGGKVTEPKPDTVVGTVPTEPTQTVPAEYAKGDAAAGKPLFTSKGCGACHTLADAGTSGTVGPDLDDAKPELALAVDRVVNGKGAMPPFKAQLSAKQIADVSAYVVEATKG